MPGQVAGPWEPPRSPGEDSSWRSIPCWGPWVGKNPKLADDPKPRLLGMEKHFTSLRKQPLKTLVSVTYLNTQVPAAPTQPPQGGLGSPTPARVHSSGCDSPGFHSAGIAA